MELPKSRRVYFVKDEVSIAIYHPSEPPFMENLPPRLARLEITIKGGVGVTLLESESDFEKYMIEFGFIKPAGA